MRYVLVLILVTGLLAACGGSPSSVVSNATESTVAATAVPKEPTATASPEPTATPTTTSVPSTPTPTHSRTATTTPVPSAPTPTHSRTASTTPAPTTKPATPDETRDWSTQYLESIRGCLSRTLGTDRADEIIKDSQNSTDEEATIITNCSKPGAKEQRSSSDQNRSKNGKDRSTGDTTRDDSRRTAWKISPSQIACVFEAISRDAYREIYNGARPATTTELQASQPCLPGSRTLNHVPHELASEQCPSLEILQRNIFEYQPRWDQLDCHLKQDFQRLPLPRFRTSARINPIVLIPPPPSVSEVGCQGLLCPEGTEGIVVKDLWNGDLAALIESMEAESWEQFASGRYPRSRLDHLTSLAFTEAEFPSATFTYLPMNVFRPKTDEVGERHTFPITDYWHDAALRAYTVHVILRKRDGHITQMNLSFGGSKDVTAAKTPEEFRRWIDEFFIPQKIHEAQIAEKLKMETFKPWMTEIDVWVMEQSWALTASDQELLETGQYLLDAVAAAVRPHFSGRITPHTWAHGSAMHQGHPRPIWKELSFRGFDEVGISYFPRCDMETTMADARMQFETIMQMVKRDSISWVITEMDTNHQSFQQCGTDIFDQADEIWAAVLDLVSDLEIQPIGISTYGFGNIYSNAHKAVLEEKVFSRGNT